MTRCRDVDRLVTAYVEAELDERRSSAVRGHLRVCRRCAERVEDEARLRELAADLETIDPPPAMWQAIEARLADAEIGDSRRPAFWLWVERAVDGARRNSLALGLGTAAVALFAILLVPRGGGPDKLSGEAQPVAAAGREAPAPAHETTPGSCDAIRTHDDEIICQVRAADRRYLDAIAELGRAVAEERTSWAASEAARFDSALAELDRAAEIERVRLAGQMPGNPAARDPLHAIYRAQIDLLTSAVVAGDLTVAAHRRGGP